MPQKAKNKIVTQGRVPEYKTLTFFGDSITVGAFDKEGMGGWVGRLSRLVSAKSRHEYIFENKAACGNTTIHTFDDIRFASQGKLQTDLVIVNSGLNDTVMFGKKCNLSDAKRMKAWAGILNIARKEKWPMLVIGLPGVQGDIVEIRTKNGRLAYTIKMTEINKYNKALKNLCAKRGIPFLNVSGQWQKNKGKGLFAADGFHLNVRGHQLLATQVYKQIKKMKILQAGLK